ncbi:MAG: hypothetical protein F4Z74_05430 [Acidobacteria bacterium]|nr:hypothetical protein [Acidobacteriota bacterium]MYE44282.1 hypothetical protein [Acidobacteriota bacterium]
MAVEEWEAENGASRLVPTEYIEWLQGLNVNWLLLSVSLHYEDSLDSTVSRETGHDRSVPTFKDASLEQLLRELREHGFSVYLTLAFEAHRAETAARPVHRWQLGDPAPPETGGVPPDDPTRGLIAAENWPWRPDHPDHQRFVREFWRTYTEQAVHFAQIAEDADVPLFSLGTETDRLFRSRASDGYMHNDYGDELREMVAQVREVYSGRLTYDMHRDTLTASDFFGPGSGAGHLWEDLDLDLVGVSAWFRLRESAPETPPTAHELQATFEDFFRTHLVPLAGRNPGRAIVFTEFGAMDLVEAVLDTGDSSREGETKVVADVNRNGLDDGEETQANIYQAFFDASERFPGLVNGAFLWNNWIHTKETWARHWARERHYGIRGKPAEAVVRGAYGRLAGR